MNLTNRVVLMPLWAVLYFVLGYASHKINGPFAATGYIWLPAGVTMAAFMLAPMRRWPALGLVFLAAQMLLGAVEGRDAFRMLLFSLDEIGFAALAVALVHMTQFSLEGLAFLRGLLLAAVVASVGGAIFGAGWFWLFLDVPFWATAKVWAAADFVGVLIVTPVFAGWARFSAARSGGRGRGEFIFGIAALLGVLVTAGAAFDGTRIAQLSLGMAYALTYIPLFFVAIAALLLGGRGGSVAVALLATLVLVNTMQGDGPFADTAIYHGYSLLAAQIYLAVAALVTLLISTLRTAREQLHELAANRQNDVELALAASSQLVYNLDPHSGRLRWSGSVERAFGLPESAFSTLGDVLACVHPDDRAEVRRRWLHEIDGEVRDDLTFRLVLPSGAIVDVVDMSGPLLDGDDSVALIAGAWRVTVSDTVHGREGRRAA